MGFIDVHVETGGSAEMADMAKRLGLDSFVCAGPNAVSKAGPKVWPGARCEGEGTAVGRPYGHVYTGVIVRPKKGQVAAEARANRNADVVFAQGNEDVNREASECWEVDVIASPELSSERDYTRQRGSGIDLPIAKFCAERGIAIEFNFNNILQSYGDARSRLLGRMAQNVTICRRAKCPMLITSGARALAEMRDATVLMAFGEHVGMTAEEAKGALTTAPARILEKADRRRDPNVITKGLTVLDWGDCKREEKRQFGWY